MAGMVSSLGSWLRRRVFVCLVKEGVGCVVGEWGRARARVCVCVNGAVWRWKSPGQGLSACGGQRRGGARGWWARRRRMHMHMHVCVYPFVRLAAVLTHIHIHPSIHPSLNVSG